MAVRDSSFEPQWRTRAQSDSSSAAKRWMPCAGRYTGRHRVVPQRVGEPTCSPRAAHGGYGCRPAQYRKWGGTLTAGEPATLRRRCKDPAPDRAPRLARRTATAARADWRGDELWRKQTHDPDPASHHCRPAVDHRGNPGTREDLRQRIRGIAAQRRGRDKVLEAVTAATGAVNAVEAANASQPILLLLMPRARQCNRSGSELAEAGGGGIDGARKQPGPRPATGSGIAPRRS